MTRPSIESLFDATIIIDGGGVVRTFGEAAERTFGRMAADVVGSPLTDLIPRFPTVVTETRWRTPAKDAAGSLFRIEVAVWPRDEGDERLVLIRDLRDHDQQATAEEDGWWEVDLVSRRGFWSPHVFQLHGVAPRSFVPTIDSVMPLIEADDRPAVTASLQAMVAGQPVAPFEYRLASPPAGIRILRTTVAEDSSSPDTAHGTCTDVTAQRLDRARLDVHKAIASTLGNWEANQQEVRSFLQRLFLVLGWRITVAWVPNGDILSCRGFVTETGMEVHGLEATTRALRPRPGNETLCGQAWAACAPRAAADIAETSLLRADAAMAEGIRGGMAIPAIHGGEVLAVFEFFTTERRDLEPQILDTLDAVGRQLGLFLSTRQSLLAPPLLTEREIEILHLGSQGGSVRDIASRLGISPATVKTHFQNVYGKLGVNDRQAAVALALRTGLIA